MAIKIKVSDLLGKYKMTQKELSDRTGIRPATISALYHETIKRIEIEHIEKLCEVFNCQPGDILSYEGNKPKKS
jgi:putative transcriptional regulator